MRTKTYSARMKVDHLVRKLIVSSIGSEERKRCLVNVSYETRSRVFNDPRSTVTLETLIRVAVTSGLRFEITIGDKPVVKGHLLDQYNGMRSQDMDRYIRVLRIRLAYEIRRIARSRGLRVCDVEKGNGLPRNSLTRRTPPMVDTLVNVLLRMSVRRILTFNQWIDEYPLGVK